MWDLSSPPRDQTHIPCIGRWRVKHWTTKGSPQKQYLKAGLSDPKTVPIPSVMAPQRAENEHISFCRGELGGWEGDFPCVSLQFWIYYLLQNEQIKVMLLLKSKITVVCVYTRLGADGIRGCCLTEQRSLWTWHWMGWFPSPTMLQSPLSFRNAWCLAPPRGCGFNWSGAWLRPQDFWKAP